MFGVRRDAQGHKSGLLIYRLGGTNFNVNLINGLKNSPLENISWMSGHRHMPIHRHIHNVVEDIALCVIVTCFTYHYTR